MSSMSWIIGTIYSVSWSLDEFDQLEKFNNKFGSLFQNLKIQYNDGTETCRIGCLFCSVV